jgi:hypothetical protein
MDPLTPAWKHPRLRYFAPNDDELGGGGGKPADDEQPPAAPKPSDVPPKAPAAGDDEDPGENAEIPAWMQKRLTKSAKEAARYREERDKAAETAAEKARREEREKIGKAFGFIADEESPEDAVKRLQAERDAEKEQLTAAQQKVRDLEIKSATTDALSEHKAKRSVIAFMRGEGLFDDLDPADAGFAAAVSELVKKTVADNPEFAVTPTPDSTGDSKPGGDNPPKQELQGVDARRAERRKRTGQ